MRISDWSSDVCSSDLVSRDEYARFANATGREPARCRVSASLLRVLAPRDWTSPGFEQSGNAPVVCVSWEDANAYARWLAQRSEDRKRVGEGKSVPVRVDLGSRRSIKKKIKTQIN